MAQTLATVALVVADYDDAIAYFCDTLGFDLVADTAQSGGKRWVVVAPRSSKGAELLLARADTDEQRAHIGNQTGGRVAFFLRSDNLGKDHETFSARGVKFLEAPREEPYGKVAVFADLYGNKWDLIEPSR